MTDRELLEAAAKAAGLKTVPEPFWACALTLEDESPWRPLTDDGDALRLMIKLRMDFHSDSSGVMAVNFSDGYEEPFKGDEMAATRRAIVRAAAALAVSDLAKMEGAK